MILLWNFIIFIMTGASKIKAKMILSYVNERVYRGIEREPRPPAINLIFRRGSFKFRKKNKHVILKSGLHKILRQIFWLLLVNYGQPRYTASHQCAKPRSTTVDKFWGDLQNPLFIFKNFVRYNIMYYICKLNVVFYV